jgi:hypothetical protein
MALASRSSVVFSCASAFDPVQNAAGKESSRYALDFDAGVNNRLLELG